MLLDEVKLKQAKTKEMFQILKNLNLENKKVLLLKDIYDSTVLRASENIPFLKVYGRQKESCFNCGKEILKIKLGGRGTHSCPSCQK